MSDKPEIKILKNQLDEVQSHLGNGNQRIKSWYCDDYDHPEDFPELEEAPHTSLITRGAELVDFAGTSLKDDLLELGDPENDAEIILYGVGIERIISGIHLKLNPMDFIETLEKKGQTPSFPQSKQVVISDLADHVSSDECGKMVMTLDILWKLRNNEVHFGFHSYTPHRLSTLVTEAAYVLLLLYGEEECEELESLRGRVKAERERLPDPARTVEFDTDQFSE